MESEEQRYFHRVEEAFIRLRGSPLLLSPADWKTAGSWRTAGMPVGFVIHALEEIFASRRERDVDSKVNSLRYCDRQVKKAWAVAHELLGPTDVQTTVDIDVGARLALLGMELAKKDGLAGLGERIVGLEGDTASVEEELARLDVEMLDRVEASLPEADRQGIELRVEERLAKLHERLAEDELVAARRKLLEGEIRRHRGLPVLSLFSGKIDV